MEFSFPWPLSQGEWLAWGTAALTVFFGVVLLFAPGIAFKLLRLQPKPEHPEAIAEARSTMAGFYLGSASAASCWRSRCFTWRSVFPGCSRRLAVSFR